MTMKYIFQDEIKKTLKLTCILMTINSEKKIPENFVDFEVLTRHLYKLC